MSDFDRVNAGVDIQRFSSLSLSLSLTHSLSGFLSLEKVPVDGGTKGVRVRKSKSIDS